MYVHKTVNELVFDKLRSLAFEIDELAAYISFCGRDNEKEAQSLSQASTIVFDQVYKKLRSSWN